MTARSRIIVAVLWSLSLIAVSQWTRLPICLATRWPPQRMQPGQCRWSADQRMTDDTPTTRPGPGRLAGGVSTESG
jgi:hypothetical protein